MTEVGEGEPKEVRGFVVLSGDDSYLAKDGFWFQHDAPEEAFVFTEESARNKIKTSKNENWDQKPTDVIPATWDGKNVKVTGEKIEIGNFLETKE